ncbi:MAG: diphthine--ammonia ligase [Candidatus Hodarchaeales archaeon]
MKVTCLVSGGKDSILALWIALHKYEVSSILTIQTTNIESYLFHIPNSKYVSLVAQMLEIPFQTLLIEDNNINHEINELKKALKETNSKAIITGGLRSDFQRYKFNKAAKFAGMRCFSPLWRLSPRILMKEILNNNFYVIIVAVSSMGFGKKFLGERITFNMLKDIKEVSFGDELVTTGEGGEYESFVLDAPFFPSKIKVLESRIHWNETREEGYYEIIKAQLVKKREEVMLVKS